MKQTQWAALVALGAASLVTLGGCTERQSEAPWTAPPDAPRVAAPAVRDGVTVEQRNAMAEAVEEAVARHARASSGALEELQLQQQLQRQEKAITTQRLELKELQRQQQLLQYQPAFRGW